MEYVSIRVSTLRGDQNIAFDCFIKINEKYVLYLRQGDSFEGERLKRLKDKKLKKMFIPKEMEAKYLDYMKKNIEMAYDEKSTKSIESRAEIIQGQQESNAEQVMENPENQVAYGEAKMAAQQYVQFLLKNPNAKNAVLNIENTDKNLAHHGVSVSTFAVAIAEKIGIAPKQTELMALGALIHDIGHQNTTINLYQPLSQMKKEELSIFKEHPLVGARRVNDKNHFDQQVISIINQHEECINGSGFPKGLTENKLDPLSVIVASANAMDRMLTFEGISKAEASKKVLVDLIGKHPLDHLKILSEFIKTM